jgi:hypothetical protein
MPNCAEQLRFGDQTRIMGVEAGGIGQDHQQPGGNEVRDNRGEPIVVSESELIDHHGVVLVDNRYNTKAEEAVKGGPSMEVRLAARQDIAGQEYLADHEVVVRERTRVELDELALADGCSRLEAR